MPDPSLPPAPTDVCLLLRADAERHWLHREVIPVLRELEARRPAEDESACAALAYLEAMWGEAAIRASAADRAHSELNDQRGPQDGREDLPDAAGRYHAAVRALRELIAARVATLMPADDRSSGHTGGDRRASGPADGDRRISERGDGDRRAGERADGERRAGERADGESLHANTRRGSSSRAA